MSSTNSSDRLTYLLCPELTFTHEALVLIPTCIGDFSDFFPGTFPQTMKLNHRVLSSGGGRLWRPLCSLVLPKTQHLKSLFGNDIVYLQQLQHVNSNGGGGPQLLTRGCVYANKAASQMDGTFWVCLHRVTSCAFSDRISIWFVKTFPFTLGHINVSLQNGYKSVFQFPRHMQI